MPDKIKIVVEPKEGEGERSEAEFDRDEIVLGRLPTNDLVLPDTEKAVSGRHARSERRQGRFRLFDQGSANGTFLNGKRLQPNRASDLKDGDVLAIGKFKLTVAIQVDKAGPLAEVRTAVESLDPDQARALLDWLLLRESPSASVLPQAADVATASQRLLADFSTRFLGDGAFKTPEEVERFGVLLTQMVEFCLKWLSKSIEARADFQTEHSINLTRVDGREANPITKAREPREIGRLLLDWRTPRDIALVHNILDDTFRDLVTHQVGLLRAIEDTIHAVLRRLDPKTIEMEVMEKAGGGLSSMMAALNLTKRAWERYGEYYQEFLKDRNRLLNEIITPNVKKGYQSAQTPTKGDTRPRPT